MESLEIYIFCVKFGNIMELCDVLSPKCDIDWVVLNQSFALETTEPENGD